MHMLTGAVMLAAALSTGPSAAAAALPPVTAAPVASMAQTAVNLLPQLESTARRVPGTAEPAGRAAEPIDAEPPATRALTQISAFPGRQVAAAPGERAPPRR